MRKHGAKAWQARVQEMAANVSDDRWLADGKAVPSGISDLILNGGFVNVGVDHETGLACGRQQMEQDRASALFFHFHQLAGKSLTSLETSIELLSQATTQEGFTGTAVKDDTNSSPTGLKISDEDLAALNITKNPVHGEGNYTLHPQ